MIAEEFIELQTIGNIVPPVDLPDEAAKPLGLGEATFDTLDFGALVAMRRAHQTYQAAHGVRTKQSPNGADEMTKTKLTLRRRLIRGFHEALKEAQDNQAAGTGKERSARWQESYAPGGRKNESGTEELTAGNSANAALAAENVAKQVSLIVIYICYYLLNCM